MGKIIYRTCEAFVGGRGNVRRANLGGSRRYCNGDSNDPRFRYMLPTLS